MTNFIIIIYTIYYYYKIGHEIEHPIYYIGCSIWNKKVFAVWSWQNVTEKIKHLV